jgi:hypothetical protein
MSKSNGYTLTAKSDMVLKSAMLCLQMKSLILITLHASAVEKGEKETCQELVSIA